MMEDAEAERYVDEFGRPIPRYSPVDPEKRHAYASFSAAAKAAIADLVTVHDPFVDSLVARWDSLFPGLPARPGRFDPPRLYLYVKSAALNFAVRPRLAAIRRAIAAVPGAPKRLEVRLEIHSS